MKVQKKTILPLILLLLIHISELIMDSVHFFYYCDEVFSVLFVIVILYYFFTKKEVREYKRNIIILCIIIFVIGIISNLIFGMQSEIFAIMLDVVANFKLPVCLIGYSLILDKDSAKEIINFISPIAKGFIITGFICCIISLVFDIGMRGQMRFGIWGFNFLYNYAHIYSMILLFSLIIVSITIKNNNKFNNYLIATLIQLVLTTKGTSIVTAAAIIFVLYMIKNNSKLKLKDFIPIGIMGIILGNYQIKTYYMNPETPRSLILNYAFKCLAMFFPLGAGFATYGSDMANKFYSNLYYEFGFDKIWGMHKGSLFLNDNYWPMILGQFGLIGFACSIYMLYLFFSIIQESQMKKRTKAIVLSCFIYMLIASLGTTIFTTSATIILGLGMIIAIISSIDTNETEIVKLNEPEKEVNMMKTHRDSWKETIKRAIKKGDLFDKIYTLGIMKTGYSNIELQALQIRYKKYNNLYEKYEDVLKKINYPKDKMLSEPNKNVWVCWFQGMENAPEVVKICNKSLYKYMGDKEIHIITEKNMNEYVELPDYILEKWKKGIISYAHLSDILRTELLIKYGGMWVDATTLFTEPVPEYVYRKPLFLLQYKTLEDLSMKINSWFIYAQPNCRILRVVRDLLYAYWKEENIIKEYFLWHHFVQMAFSKYKEDYENIDYVSEMMSHCLFYNLFKKYDEEYWKQIKRCSSIHKLSYYKFATPDEKIPKDIKDTFYEKLLDGKLK